MIEIKNRYTGAVIKAVDAETLINANLQEANLWRADLREANLQEANLRGADLWRANLRGANLKIYQAGRYTAYIHPDHTRIGCQYHSNAEWLAFSDEQIGEMASDALEWWTENKPIVAAIMGSLPVRVEGLKTDE